MKLQCLFVMDEVHHPLLFGREELARLRREVDILGPMLSPRQVLTDGAVCAQADAIISSWGMPALAPEVLAKLPRLKAVFHAAGTVRGIVTAASWDRGIRITSAAAANAIPTAEFAFAQIILSLKRTWELMLRGNGRRTYRRDERYIRGTYGSKVGLLSLGRVGRLVAARLRSLDVTVLAYDPTIPAADAAELGVDLRELDDIFAESDVVSCHMPLTSHTLGTLRRNHFARMKPGATFINTARGSLVHEGELADVLRERPDLFAVLDVLELEPPAEDCPLLPLPNVIITPHIAGSLGQECRRLGRMVVEEIERYLSGLPLQGEVRREQMDILA